MRQTILAAALLVTTQAGAVAQVDEATKTDPLSRLQAAETYVPIIETAASARDWKTVADGVRNMRRQLPSIYALSNYHTIAGDRAEARCRLLSENLSLLTTVLDYPELQRAKDIQYFVKPLRGEITRCGSAIEAAGI